MKIKINGEFTELQEDSVSVTQLLKLQNVKWPEMVTVEHNDTVLNRDQFSNIQVKEGDEIELLYYMGGGSQGEKEQ